MAKRERERGKRKSSNSKLIWAIVIIVVIALAISTFLLLKKFSPQLEPSLSPMLCPPPIELSRNRFPAECNSHLADEGNDAHTFEENDVRNECIQYCSVCDWQISSPTCETTSPQTFVEPFLIGSHRHIWECTCTSTNQGTGILARSSPSGSPSRSASPSPTRKLA